MQDAFGSLFFTHFLEAIFTLKAALVKKACGGFVVLTAESPESLLFILHLEFNASFPIFIKDEAGDRRFATGLLWDS